MKSWLAFAVGVLVGSAVGGTAMFVAYPFLFPPPVVAERPPEAEGVTERGSFKFDETSPGRDAVHWANGTGRIYTSPRETVVRLDDTFEAGPGPNFWIYLNSVPVGDEASFASDTKRLKIAPLKSFTGGQNYVVPAGVRMENYAAVTIWCESFSAFIATAQLPRL